METSQVETLLRDELKLDEVIVKANGSHYEVIALVSVLMVYLA